MTTTFLKGWLKRRWKRKLKSQEMVFAMVKEVAKIFKGQ